MATVACISQFPLRAVPPDGCAFVESEPYRNPLPLDEAELQIAEFVVASIGLDVARTGCDALFVNTVADYGVRHLRRFVRGPVVGAGEAAYAAACALGVRFSVVTVWPPMLGWIQSLRLEQCGVTGRCASVRFVTDDDDVRSADDRRELLLETQACDRRLVERTAEQMAAAVAVDGADAIVLGCTCMSALGAALASQVSVPIVDPEAVGARLAAELASRHGPVTIRHDARSDGLSIGHLVAELGRRAADLLDKP